MSNSDNTNASIDPEEDAATNADRLIKLLRDELMHQSIDADTPNEGIKTAAVAAEFDSRLSERIERPPTNIDPREAIETDGHEHVVDEWLGDIADDLAEHGRKLEDAHQRELMLDIVAELDTRIGGGV